MFWTSLYNLENVKDLTINLVRSSTTFSGAASAFTVNVGNPQISVPRDRVLVCTMTAVDTVAGAAQTPVSWLAYGLSADGNESCILGGGNFGNSVAAQQQFGVLGYMPMMAPGQLLQFRVTFSAGAAVNAGVCHFTGLMVPRGGIQA